MRGHRDTSPSFVWAVHFVHAALILVLSSSVAPLSAGDDVGEANRNTNATIGSLDRDLMPFLREFCIDCHGPDEQSADRRFDRLAAMIDSDNDLVDYQDITDQLNLSAMPPEDAAQPSDEQRRRAISWLTERMNQYHEANRSRARQPVLRRLNSREYRNTIRDLLKIDTTIFDPTIRFPRDQTSEHLDNVGETLVLSGHLLARYLDAAGVIVDKALLPIEKPETRTWRFTDNFRQQPEIDQVHRKTNGFDHMTLYDVIGADKHEGAYGPILQFAEGVPVDGEYQIRFKAEAVNRINPYDPDFLGVDPDQPLRLGIRPGNQDVGELHLPQPIEPLLAEVELADESEWYTVNVHLDAGYTPRFTYRNGLMDARRLWTRIIRKYPQMFPEDVKPGIVSMRFNAIKHGKLPHIRIHEIEIKGPIFDRWPRPSQQALFGSDWEGKNHRYSDADLRQRVKAFATRAFRRAATDQEVDRVMDIIRRRRQQGRSWPLAYGDGIKAILCSPHFLYLEETSTSSPYKIASRLSYFLWSSMPDQTLFDLAADESLEDPQILRQQVDRMLRDPKSDAFVNGFLDSWLVMRELGATPPDRNAFVDFYHYDLGTAMRQETSLFTRHLIEQNLPTRNFIDSDFTFVNPALARLYGCEAPSGHGFAKVRLDDPRRGGLLGQASVLTVTANGIDTSPVVRGVWLLENLLGTPPNPPPPDVEPLDPDVRGATSIRDQLEKHRSFASCNDCHRKIDPLGFALENFDPIGGWRDRYDRNTPVDASGTLPGGKAFVDVVGLKKILLQQEDQFARAIVEKLLAYALGRHLQPSDRPHIDRILETTAAEGYPLRDVITEVVLSEPFIGISGE